MKWVSIVLAFKLMMWRSKSKHVSDRVFAVDTDLGKPDYGKSIDCKLL